MLVRIYILKSKTGNLDIYSSYEKAIENITGSHVATWHNAYYTEFHSVDDAPYNEPEYTIERHTIVLDNDTKQVID